LIWTGRLERQKGLDLLLAALELCLHEGGRFRLDLYGEGKLRTALTMQVQTLGLNGHVYFHDAVSPAVVRERLLDSDVFVLPSRYEGMSNSALEAMEASLPVLCTHCGGIDTFIGDEAGWVCEPDSVAALTDTLRRMFRTPDADLLARGSMARRLIEERFAMEHVAAANLDLLEQVAMTSRQRD
jgi:glycosyltransferase involved in cell wall biosynthesis